MKRTKSLYFRNFLHTALIVVMSFLLLGGAFTYAGYRMVLRQQEQSMLSVANQYVRSISAFHANFSLDSFEVKIITNTIGSASDADILVADPDGVIVSCSDSDFPCEHTGKAVSAETIASLQSDNRFGRTNLDGVYGEKKNVVCRPILARNFDTGEETVLGYVFLSSRQSVAAVLWREYLLVFLILAAGVMLLSFVLSYFTTKKQTDPIRQMAGAAEKFAKGDYTSRVDYRGGIHEIDALADAFNKMADSVEQSENNRREFVANVSHELKTPMTSISGFADGILDGTIPRSRQNEYLSIISSETKRLSRLVRSMLDMSQLQAREPGAVLGKTFDLCEVMRLALLSLEHKITDKGLDVDAQLPEEAVMVRGEQDAINQVVYNLIDNAAKFAPRGSVLRLAVWKQTGKAYVSVENDGETISPEELPLIFDRFHKTDKSRSQDRDGVGLGLYIVKTILDNHGEDIFVTSRDGVTRFVFTMTVAEK
ncbi:MAG: HAMP domain-containing histidine kinase [Oscillospiraceae bacterium]|nr:HAMP domain-containing histidine kinase [Oscillospiraceae bacterium]